MSRMHASGKDISQSSLPYRWSFSTGDMHRCAAKCYDNRSLSTEETHLCIESCCKTITEAQTFQQNELEIYQVMSQLLNYLDSVHDWCTLAVYTTSLIVLIYFL